MGTDAGFVNAKYILESLDSGLPFDMFSELVVEDAPFTCQAESLRDIKTVEAYARHMTNFERNIAPGCKPEPHNLLWDAEKRTAMLFATYHAKHTKDGGPVPPTNKETKSDYCFVIRMDEEDRCLSITKIWNDTFCFQELGWAT